jgi:cell wall-associated NlpC family hydrolase
MKSLVHQIAVDNQRAAEAAARARIAAQQVAARQATSNNGGGGGGGGGQGITVDPSTIPAPSAGAQAAVAYAYAQLGKPYRYAGVGPESYDCSGLTMMAWARGGVGMAHGSQSQYMSFPKIPISQLQPGDLVFFGSSGPTNHHVGLVVGGGMMIDAPHTGAFVEKVSYMRGDLVPLGARP